MSGRYLATSGAALWMILCLCARGSLVARKFSPPRRTIGVAPSFHSIRQMRKNARTKTEQPNRPLTMRKEAVQHTDVGDAQSHEGANLQALPVQLYKQGAP